VDLARLAIKKNTDSLNILRKDKGGKAIMEVDGSICPGCYLDLPSDVIYQLQKNRKILICPNCSRILIWKD